MNAVYSIFFLACGRNGIMGSLEPSVNVAHELCIFIEVTSPDRELAKPIVDSCQHLTLHHPVPEWSGLITALVYP